MLNYGFPLGLHPVGEKIPNELGFYNMSDNVEEWCRDYCKVKNGILLTNTYSGEMSDPLCKLGTYCVVRGGSWAGYKESSRVAERECWLPTTLEKTLGFRVALVPIEK